MTVAVVVNLLLLLGMVLRVYRLVFVDDLGLWWLQGPVAQLRIRLLYDLSTDSDTGPSMRDPRSWQAVTARYLGAVDCRYCLGFWIGCAMLGLLYLAGGPAHAALWWRLLAGVLTLNYVAAHLSVWAGDIRE